MTVQVLGRYPQIVRHRTGLFSLDWALANKGEYGVPMGTIMELYGYTNVGKSTLAYFIAGTVTGKGDVGIADLEAADRDYIKIAMENSGLDGSIHLMDVTDDKKRPVKHEVILQNLASQLKQESVGSVILDSVGGIIPTAEDEGDFGEANMGRRAKLVAQVARRFGANLRVKERPSLAIVINHVHSVIGGRGHTTAGGESLKFLAASRIMIWSQEKFYQEENSGDYPIGFQVAGKLEKLRYGGPGREFQYYIVPGYGVHTGASAMFDCFRLGLAERGTTVKLDGKSLGYLKKDFLQYASEGKHRKFEPFKEALLKYEEDNRLNLELLPEEPIQTEESVEEAPKKSRKKSND